MPWVVDAARHKGEPFTALGLGLRNRIRNRAMIRDRVRDGDSNMDRVWVWDRKGEGYGEG